MPPIFTSPPSSPSIDVWMACASTGSAATAKPAAMQAATKPRRSTCTSGSRLFSSLSPRSLRVSSMGLPPLGSTGYGCSAPIIPANSPDRRMPAPGLRRLLEGVRQLQHAEVVAVAADDLDPHGEIV